MEMKYLRCAFVLASLLAVVYCHQNDDGGDSSNTDLRPGLGRLILKQMRFRELPTLSKPSEDSSTDQLFNQWDDITDDQSLEVDKRTGSDRKEQLINDLAAILYRMMGQQTTSTARMPSLRFG